MCGVLDLDADAERTAFSPAGTFSVATICGSQQAHYTADGHVGADEQGDDGDEVPRVAEEPVLGALNLRPGALRPGHQEYLRNDH